MFWFELIVFVLIASFLGFFHLAPTSVKQRGFAPLRRWFKPIAERLCPSLKMEPWLFEPIDPAELSRKQRHHFETHSAAFLQRGYLHLGDYVIRRDRQTSCIRFFLSPDRTVIGEIGCYLGTYTVNCVSVLLDGFYIESANCAVEQLPPAEHGLQFCPVLTDDASAVIDHHLACTARTAARHRTAPAALAEADLRAVVNYGRELSLRSLHQQGMLPELPEFLLAKQSEPSTERLN